MQVLKIVKNGGFSAGNLLNDQGLGPSAARHQTPTSNPTSAGGQRVKRLDAFQRTRMEPSIAEPPKKIMGQPTVTGIFVGIYWLYNHG